MRVLQTVFGVFHHFELARELQSRGHLEAIYSTWPWARLKRENLPDSKVRTFPWIHMPEYMFGRTGMDFPWLTDELGYRNALAFDSWTTAQLRNLTRKAQQPDALIGISGSSLRAGQELQRGGGVFICDRGSTHQRYQEQIVSEEYRRWGVVRPVSDERDTIREEQIYAVADAITVPSSMARRSFGEMGVDEAKVHVIPYGVRLERFRPTAEPPTDSFDVLFAGAVGLRKGIPYLLEAFSALQHPHKRLRIAGSVQADAREVLTRLPTDNVEFLGSLPQQQLAEWMSRSHVLVLPSIEEGLALVQAQALACGCPVIASTNTGAEDLFKDGLEGFIVPIRDVAALTNRMERLVSNRDLQAQMRAAALRRVQHLGGWHTYGDRWEELLLTLTAANGR